MSNWYEIGWGLDRSPDGKRLVKLYLDVESANPLLWSAEFAAMLPHQDDTYGLGGLAAHPTDEDKLFVLADQGSDPARLYTYRISTAAWTHITFEHQEKYWGLGSRCDGTLTTVRRPYTKIDGVRGTLISFSPDNPGETTTILELDHGIPVGDNAVDYATGATWTSGLTAWNGGEPGPSYLTSDGKVRALRGIAETWISGMMSNRFPSTGGEERRTSGFFVSAANSTRQSSATPLYLIRRNRRGVDEVVPMDYLEAFGLPQPNLVDLANVAGWCNEQRNAALRGRDWPEI
ncbi:MAG: hypothetical protein H6707_19110 [Deltaproteobacteria bacterium]|nr:hypothetical protein [Deltaproteobacteria bacterium]